MTAPVPWPSPVNARATGAPSLERLRSGDEIAGELTGLDNTQVHAVETVARELEES